MENARTSAKQKKVEPIPARLIKEELDGIKLYYKGYHAVVDGQKTNEDISPSSGLHALLLTYLTLLIGRQLNETQYG
ncbi:MAG TPA: hypothetical protein PKA00_01525 [Saprospiraceae bacterium]|nr:hypothetical protein [Saprospiraceae bacterium]HMQ81549.1 hypothetical protein [Saprospiraceae bacterium]